jgi:large subunit ribosomal protein L6
MSRIGKQPIALPGSVEVTILDGRISVRGPKGELTLLIHPSIEVTKVGQEIRVKPKNSKAKNSASLWGLTRALVFNLIKGVEEGYCKKLEIEGVGFRAQVQGSSLVLSLGFSHPVTYTIPASVSVAVQGNIIEVAGPDKYLVGQVAADIRAFKKPEPYKGKGIHYVGEHIRRKAGKKVATTTG